jgi:hypothetical protein
LNIDWPVTGVHQVEPGQTVSAEFGKSGSAECQILPQKAE